MADETTDQGAVPATQDAVPAFAPVPTDGATSVSQTPEDSADVQVLPVPDPQVVPEVKPQDGTEQVEKLNPIPDAPIDTNAEPSVPPSTYAAGVAHPAVQDLPIVFDVYTHSTSATPGASTDTTTTERFPHEADALLSPPTPESDAANNRPVQRAQ